MVGELIQRSGSVLVDNQRHCGGSIESKLVCEVPIRPSVRQEMNSLEIFVTSAA